MVVYFYFIIPVYLNSIYMERGREFTDFNRNSFQIIYCASTMSSSLEDGDVLVLKDDFHKRSEYI